jgi:hypothetical protein
VFCALVQYCQSRVELTQELEKRYENNATISDGKRQSIQPKLTHIHTHTLSNQLNTNVAYRLADAGYGIGLRVLELQNFREKGYKKCSTLVAMLQFIYSNVWKSLFGKAADGLEKSTEKADECTREGERNSEQTGEPERLTLSLSLRLSCVLRLCILWRCRFALSTSIYSLALCSLARVFSIDQSQTTSMTRSR